LASYENIYVLVSTLQQLFMLPSKNLMRYQANLMEHSLHRKTLRNEFIVAFMQPFGGMKELHQNLDITAISELSSWNRMQKVNIY